jgi:hypothetical protein
MKKEAYVAKACDNVEKLLTAKEAELWLPRLDAVANLSNGLRIVSRAIRAKGPEDLRDCFAEVLYALTFTGLRFLVDVEPLGEKGPDLAVERNGRKVLVEVSRLRLKREMPTFAPEELPEMLPCLGNPVPDIRRAYQKICDKIPQFGSEEGILAIWNDDEVLDKAHGKTAAHWISEELRAGRLKRAEQLQIIVFHTNWISMPTQQEYFAWAVRSTEPDWLIEWRRLLESARLSDLLHTVLCPNS